MYDPSSLWFTPSLQWFTPSSQWFTPSSQWFTPSSQVHLLHPDALSVRVAHHLLRAPYAAASARRRKGKGAGEDDAKGEGEGAAAAARFERGGFVANAQLTRLLVGDELGDALQLPFELRAREAARRRLAWVRLYSYAS